MGNIDKRLEDAFDKVAVCHCGNGIADGCCDNHNPSWNPCPDSQLLYDARYRIAELEAAVKVLAKGGSDMAVMIDKYAAVDTDKQETVDAYIAAAAQCRQSADAVEDNPIAAAAVREAAN